MSLIVRYASTRGKTSGRRCWSKAVQTGEFVPMGIWTVIYSLVIAMFITTRLMRMVDDERPSSTIAPLVLG